MNSVLYQQSFPFCDKFLSTNISFSEGWHVRMYRWYFSLTHLFASFDRQPFGEIEQSPVLKEVRCILCLILQIIKNLLYLHGNINAYSSGFPFLFYIRPHFHSCFIFVRISTPVLYSSGIFSHFILIRFFYTTNHKKVDDIVRTI